MVLEDLFMFLHFFIRPPPIHPYFYPSTTVSTHPYVIWPCFLAVHWSRTHWWFQHRSRRGCCLLTTSTLGDCLWMAAIMRSSHEVTRLCMCLTTTSLPRRSTSLTTLSKSHRVWTRTGHTWRRWNNTTASTSPAWQSTGSHGNERNQIF